MKIFGTISEIVKVVFRLSGGKEVKLDAAAQSGLSTDRTFRLPDANTSASPWVGTLVEVDLPQTLTYKTIDGDVNTLQDVGIGSLKTVLADADKALVRDAAGAVTSAKIANPNISDTAAIALSKLATGALPSAITVDSSNIINGSITNDDINSAAGIVDTKLATISTAGKVSGSAITSGTIGGSTAVNTSGTVTASSFSGPLDSSSVNSLQGLTYGVTTTSLVSNTFAAGVPFVRVIGGTTLETITSPSNGKFLILVNEVADVTIKNDFGTTSNSIFTGTGSDYTLKGSSAVSLIYDSGISRWVLTGGAGTGGGGTVLQVSASTASLAVGDVMYLSGTTFTQAKADAANTAEVVGVISKIIDVSSYELTLAGAVSKAGWGLTPGGVYFLSPSTAGALTLTEPSTLGQVSVPVGVAQNSSTLLVAPKRGSVVGGTNARTQLSWSVTGTQDFQSVTNYEAGEVTGWVSTTGTPNKKFYIAIQFAKNAAGTDYNVSYQTTGETPPAGFSVGYTSGTSSLNLVIPAGVSSTTLNYALNAPAVGATFPLSVDASSITTGIMGASRIATDGSAFSSIGWNTGAASVVMSATSPTVQRIASPTSAVTVTLPTTGIKAGYQMKLIVLGATETNYVALQSSGANEIDRIGGDGVIEVIALQDSPTTAAHWSIINVNERVNKSILFTAGLGSGATYFATNAYMTRTLYNLNFSFGNTTTGTTGTTTSTSAITSLAGSIPTRFIPWNGSGAYGVVEVQEAGIMQAGILGVLSNGQLAVFKITEAAWATGVSYRTLASPIGIGFAK